MLIRAKVVTVNFDKVIKCSKTRGGERVIIFNLVANILMKKSMYSFMTPVKTMFETPMSLVNIKLQLRCRKINTPGLPKYSTK